MRVDQRQLHREKDRSWLLSMLETQVQHHRMDPNLSVLVIGGSESDLEVLKRVGFQTITLSDLVLEPLVTESATSKADLCVLDAEAMAVSDESYDLVVAFEVLHHCRSPHRALCEMIRVSRRYVLFLEPNDSLFMRTLVRLRMSFPYELPAVIHHEGKTGGVRDTQVPNYIYRWNKREVFNTVSSFIPDRFFSVDSQPYWDFSVDEYGLSLRTKTKLGLFTGVLGARNFLRALRAAATVLNLSGPLRRQGNKHLCVIEKQNELRPWLRREGGAVVFFGDNGSRGG
jgi:SAM-dependent methyltransferase